MKTAGLLTLTLAACLINMGAGTLMNYSVSFYNNNYFNYGIESDDNAAIILRSIGDMNHYIDALLYSYKRDNARFPVDYFETLEKDIRTFYSRFNENFFKDKTLIIALVDRGSGSLSFKLTDLIVKNEKLIARIKRNSPQIQTMDYRLWVMMLEVNKNYFDGDSIEIKLI